MDPKPSQSRQKQTGWLTTGYGGSKHHIGPEYGFGFTVGDHFEDPVLLIKCAWGGKSLYKDFRPPSSDDYPEPKKNGDKGYITNKLSAGEEGYKQPQKHYPHYEGNGYEIVGFG